MCAIAGNIDGAEHGSVIQSAMLDALRLTSSEKRLSLFFDLVRGKIIPREDWAELICDVFITR